ncbi:MAG TPA: hypothetical protein DEB25_06395 [Desulfobulbaceae bacterium]|nr:hypothetical protein [Desulfobulbaceae bacterium]
MKGKGYIEFLACKEEILTMLDRGYTKIYVYNMLLSQGKISTTRWNFYRVLKKLGIKKRKLEKLKIGAELAAEAAKKHPMKPDQQMPEPGFWSPAKPAEKPPERPDQEANEAKRKTGDDDQFGLEHKTENDHF